MISLSYFNSSSLPPTLASVDKYTVRLLVWLLIALSVRVVVANLFMEWFRDQRYCMTFPAKTAISHISAKLLLDDIIHLPGPPTMHSNYCSDYHSDDAVTVI